MNRITEKDLQNVVDRINRVTGSPMTSYTKSKDGTYKPNALNYHLDSAYGGWELVRMCEQGSGVTTPLGPGHMPKRELYKLMHAFLKGLENE